MSGTSRDNEMISTPWGQKRWKTIRYAFENQSALLDAAIGLMGELGRTGLADIPGDTMADLRNRCDEMRAAIAKAEGRT